MNDAEFEQQKARLIALIDRWIKPLGLAWWSIDIVYVRDDYKPPFATPQKTVSLAYCEVDWRYYEATITWNMPEVLELSDWKLERGFVHELMHIFIHEMRWTASNDADALDHEERVASTLSKAFLWLREELEGGQQVTGEDSADATK